MLNDLQNIARSIDTLLLNDPYPETVKPDYLRRAVRDYPVRGGKRLRPALVIWCCELLGGSREQALYPAAAAEVYHNWTLVHDDIIDRDDTRRGKPACHITLQNELRGLFQLSDSDAARTGRDFAILAGDLQQGWATDLILRSAEYGVTAEKILQILQKLEKYANNELISGEALDVEFSLRSPETVQEDEVREMIYLKTGALLRFCAETGAILGNGTSEEIARLGRFASAAGMAFQLRDDYLGIFGDFPAFGKAIGGDLREKKTTLLLSKTFSMSSDSGRKTLLSLLGQPQYTQAELETVREIMYDAGEAVREEAQNLADESKEILCSFPASPTRSRLLELVDYLIDRQI